MGQDEAKRMLAVAVYNHYIRVRSNLDNLEKMVQRRGTLSFGLSFFLKKRLISSFWQMGARQRSRRSRSFSTRAIFSCLGQPARAKLSSQRRSQSSLKFPTR